MTNKVGLSNNFYSSLTNHGCAMKLANKPPDVNEIELSLNLRMSSGLVINLKMSLIQTMLNRLLCSVEPA